MNPAIEQMLKRYDCSTSNGAKNALKEILQEIALLGLWRAKFFENAAFYGGTALRILYGLDRFSEDLDFSLLAPNPDFSWDRYSTYLVNELKSFGFAVAIEEKKKSNTSAIQSAFLKTNTLENLIQVDLANTQRKRVHIQDKIQIKLEIDTDPPPDFSTEAAFLLQPIAFSIQSYQLADLFAGKLHALLCRSWQTRVKGRDWYDFVWFVSRQTPVHIKHLEARLRQSGHYTRAEALSEKQLREMLENKISELNIDDARKDVTPFLKDAAATDIWTQAFFVQLLRRITVC